MGIWKFRKPEPTNIQGLCVVCGINKQTGKGGGKYRALCSGCHLERTVGKRRKVLTYRRKKGDSCEECGFVAVHKCQLDVHHIDHNHKNNDPDNLKTLCANCHRLVHA